MKRVIVLTVLFAAISAALFAQALPRLAVAEFTTNNQSDNLREVAIAVRNMVQSHMAGMRQYTMVTFDEIDLLLRNQQIQVSSISSAENIQKLQRTNINYIVTGSVNLLFGEYTIIVSLLEVSSGEYTFSDRESVGGSSREFANGVTDLMNRFTTGMVAEGDRLVQSSQRQITYNIGDRGPGGGFVFYSEGGVYMEVSLTLGSYNWDQAVEVARNHRGGGFTDWKLPNKDELNMIYQNLRRRNLASLGDDIYWSSLPNGPNLAWCQRFGDGRLTFDNTRNTYSVRAVRAF